MKRILLTLTVLVAVIFAQAQYTQGLGNKQTTIKVAGQLVADSGLTVPRKDTTNGSLGKVQVTDSVFFYHNGVRWVPDLTGLTLIGLTLSGDTLRTHALQDNTFANANLTATISPVHSFGSKVFTMDFQNNGTAQFQLWDTRFLSWIHRSDVDRYSSVQHTGTTARIGVESYNDPLVYNRLDIDEQGITLKTSEALGASVLNLYSKVVNLGTTGGTLSAPPLAGAGTRMVTADPFGNLTAQAIPVDGDNNASNELQTLTLADGVLSISGGNSIPLPAGSTPDGNTFVTSGVFSPSTGNLSLNRNDGATVSLNLDGRYLQSETDGSATNELQSLALTGLSLSISGGNTVTLPAEVDGSVSNELQTLSISGSTLSISGGNSVTLPSGGTGGTTGNLQEVTNLGNSTTNSIITSNQVIANAFRMQNGSGIGVDLSYPVSANRTVTIPDASGTIAYQNFHTQSVTNAGSGFQLVNDEASPASMYYYGTNEGGTKGFHPLPSSIGGNASNKVVMVNNQNYTVAAGVTDVVYHAPLGAVRTVYLPAPGVSLGRRLTITFTQTNSGYGLGLNYPLRNNSSFTTGMLSSGDWVEIISNGTDWVILKMGKIPINSM